MVEVLSVVLVILMIYVEIGLVEFDEDCVLVLGFIILGGWLSMGKSVLMLVLCYVAVKCG